MCHALPCFQIKKSLPSNTSSDHIKFITPPEALGQLIRNQTYRQLTSPTLDQPKSSSIHFSRAWCEVFHFKGTHRMAWHRHTKHSQETSGALATRQKLAPVCIKSCFMSISCYFPLGPTTSCKEGCSLFLIDASLPIIIHMCHPTNFCFPGLLSTHTVLSPVFMKNVNNT